VIAISAAIEHDALSKMATCIFKNSRPTDVRNETINRINKMTNSSFEGAIERRLLAYAAGAVGTLAMSQNVDAALVITTVDVTIPSFTNDYWRLETFADGAGSVSLVDASGGTDSLRVYSGGFGVYFDGEVYGDPNSGGSDLQLFHVSESGRRAAANFGPGDTVNSGGGTLTQSFTDVASLGRTFRNGFAEDVRDYTGFQMTVDGRTHYGWIDFTANSDHTITFHRFAIETTQNTGALVTAVPEPGHTAAIFALGAAGLAAYRRRRAAAKQV